MDLPGPDSSDNQSYLAPSEYESGNYTEDDWLRYLSYWYEHAEDVLEKDALNEKSRMQVLKIWIDKVDEDIVKLEEDMLILQCQQLVWDDEQWSKQCSPALREKIDHLDILLESLKKDDKENGLQSGTEELPPRLHDILKPLLESYLAKSKQTENSITQMSLPPAVELTNKKTEENASTVMLKTYERKSKTMELEERKLSLPQQKKDAAIRDFPASGDTCTDDDVTAKVISKPNTLEERRMPNVVVVKLEPTDPMANESRASRCMVKANFRDNEGKRNSDNKAISEANVVQGRIQHEMKVDSVKQRLESLCTVQKAKMYRRTSDKNQLLSVTPTVKMKGKNTRIPQTSKGVKDESSEQVKKLKMESENEMQVQQKCKECHQILQKSLPAEHEDKGTSSSENLKQRKDGASEGLSMKGKKETCLQKCKDCHQILQNSLPAEHEDKGTSSTENLKQKKDGASEGLSMKGKKETEQQLNKAPVINATPISWLREVKPSSFRSQNTSKKEALQSSQLKLVKMEHDASDSTASTNNMPLIAYPYIKNEELTVTKLRDIAKSRNLRKYSKLKKEELKKLLGLE